MLAAPIKQMALVVAVAALVMLTNLGGSRLWDRDEPRNGECAREMLARWDWVVPTFNAELRAHKPVLLYWCIMASYLCLGVNEFAARLPSALCAIGSVICVYRMGRRLFGPQAGVWAGIALATSLMFVVAGRAATPDSLLVFCTTLSLTIYVCGAYRPRFETTPPDAPPQPYSTPGHPLCGSLVPMQGIGRREDGRAPSRSDGRRSEMCTIFPQHWPTVLAMYAAMGLGVLAKGPVGLVLPTAVIGMFLLVVRLPGRCDEPQLWTTGSLLRLAAPFEPFHFLATCWSMRPLTAIFAAAAVALPWYWAVGLATNGEFLRTFFLEHNLGRATGTMEHHRGTIFFYPLTILIGFFPWSVFAVPLAIDTALQLRRRDRFHPGYLLAVCWIGVYVILFSLARTKLPSYVTPCYPALALLMGDYVDRWSRQSAAVAGRWLVAAFACLSVGGVAVAVAVPLVAKRLLPGEEWLGLIGLIPLAGGVVCIGLAAVRSYQAAAATFALSAVAFAATLFAIGTDHIDRHQQNHKLWRAIYSQSARPQVASYRILEPSWVFYCRLPIHEFTAANAAEGRVAAEQATHFLITNHDAFLITTQHRAGELAALLPPDIQAIQSAPYFLKEGQQLVVLGRRNRNPGSASHLHASAPVGNDLR